MNERPNYPVESVDKALSLLLLLRERPALSVSDAARALEVAPSTAHRLLTTLEYRGFVAQEPASRLYGPGPALLEIGLAAVRALDIRDQARPAMEALVAELGETVHLAILEGREVLFLASVETSRALRVAGRVGTRLPAHATASGKALLAHLPTERLRELFPDDTLPAFRPNTITSRAELEGALDVVRERGYATNVDESEPEVSAVAAAIVDRGGRIRAALTLSAPVSRLGTADVTRVATAIVSAARSVGELLA